MRGLVLALLTFCSTLPARAEEVVLGLSKDEVAITASFNGSDILIFGAVLREEPIPSGSQLGVVITVAGPSTPVTVRRKERRYGIWINTDAVDVDRAPSYYAVASSGPLREVLSNIEDLRYRITVPRAIRSVGAPMTILDSAAFTRALIRIRGNMGLYQVLEENVVVDQQTLFRTSIQLPSAVTEGGYITRIFLTRNGKVVSQYQTTIEVRKVGLERWLFALSRNQPLLYGLMSIAIAIAAGWGASAGFALLRR
ncbi:TIGR02186 family protein [Sulfitobacter pseudonitzschiae]|uniref:TIGR02186 family protein n=1 Tax=Pseudosulfitobacter pseudonitzschiae TaxID=1402135 RepID=A0A9Q2RU70_9RHOB|nr:TIGR02186 family protein [Pseudosulfitobacter pseudonitzschiae]MBM2291667.1 TIGR02186 family protein [Pseudosulfitobacter pseudonitzschiae]MBM2296585.1 TIGR02186 family protein [Pseudosulfitobacter pseudonitzschiae]MBM2301498.1 TIGR02186 family protein [Pseudosulfitobacter pseudonitzschiae]MBM2311282.1 TIGR02186 family protein [Pseudosulfitobacter pseudonitzschiae]MBM2316195.1 TIGR02186 family protein [Pseudosulfitobacter pseudonitzschiae]